MIIMLIRNQRSVNHRNQSIHNKVVIDTNVFPPQDPNSPNRDWSTTICFYSALHYIHCYLNRNQGYRTKFRDHGDRNDYIIKHQDPKLQAISGDYVTLYKAARKSRYNPLFYNLQTLGDIKEYYKLAYIDIPTKLGI